MTVEYQPSPEDVFQLKLALRRRAGRHPLLWTIMAGGFCIATGGVMMSYVASGLWLLLALIGFVLSVTIYLAARANWPTREKVEQDYAVKAWLRDPFRVEIDDQGLRYAHGPYRSQAAWPAFTRLIETAHHLILVERRAPGSLAYGLPKHVLDRTPGGATAWRSLIATHLPS